MIYNIKVVAYLMIINFELLGYGPTVSQQVTATLLFEVRTWFWIRNKVIEELASFKLLPSQDI
jgi:hypothetical protein